MKRLLKLAAALFFAACVIQTAGAATIDYNLTAIGGDRWQYDYTITNSGLYEPVYAFEIFFDRNLYNDLAFVVDPASWFELDVDAFGGMGIWQDDWFVLWGNPNAFLGNDGQIVMQSIDVDFNIGPGLAPDESLYFSVSFNWLGEGGPYGGQLWNMYDSDMDPDNPLAWGNTGGPDMPPVPEPGTFVLFGTGLAGLAAFYRRNQSRKAGKR